MAREHLDGLVLPAGVDAADAPPGFDRRSFILRSAVAGAAAVMTGCAPPPEDAAAAGAAAAQAPPAPQAPPLSPDLQGLKKIRNGFLAAAAIGYLCKYNATLSGAEGGCQAEIGVASAMGAALIAQAHDFPNQVIANAAEAALQHHLGMTCDPVAGSVQVPSVERCAFGAVKSWTGFMIASNEIPTNRRVDLDTMVDAMALTAREMNSKYKETSEGGLAVSVTLC